MKYLPLLCKTGVIKHPVIEGADMGFIEWLMEGQKDTSFSYVATNKVFMFLFKESTHVLVNNFSLTFL